VAKICMSLADVAGERFLKYGAAFASVITSAGYKGLWEEAFVVIMVCVACDLLCQLVHVWRLDNLH
jgi:hypothetical protein